jgi:hypothetical protein
MLDIQEITKLKKPINQYDLEGNFIKKWDSTVDASKLII